MAQSFWYLYHDLSNEAREQNILPSLSNLHGGFPDATTELAKNLEDPAYRLMLQTEYADFLKAHNEDRSLLRFHYHKLDKLTQRLQELDLPMKEFRSELMQMPLMRTFITDDEINAALSSGSGMAGGKHGIYEYWQENHSKQEKAEFLKNEYGTGGHSYAISGTSGSGEDHDAKGIHYTKSGCNQVQLNWTQVASRIDTLIQNEYYLKEQE